MSDDGATLRDDDDNPRTDDVYSVRVGLLGAVNVLAWRHIWKYGTGGGRRRSKKDVKALAQRMRRVEWQLAAKAESEESEGE